MKVFPTTAVPVPVSGEALAFDALPAIKTRHYYGSEPDGHIYTLGRLYILKDTLALSLAAFEREPESGSLITFAIGSEDSNPLLVQVTRQKVMCNTLDGTPGAPLPDIAFDFIGGTDEQGWYWGANLLLPPALLARTGVHLSPNAKFYAGLFKSREGHNALASAFPLHDPANPFDPAGFGCFEAMEY